ncbi:hypothetical protein ACHAWO_007980 [Cyclotella atomus]|uniref:Zn(2)-C6 fungal-type domain-containing protein n=1 Tax=Cyclotella atomus TaxID=382360 RepID=A0ABD3QA78_9STRA
MDALVAAPRKMGRACKDCHDDKSRCVFSSSGQSKCDRCMKQNRQCVPRISRQGERPSNPTSRNDRAKSPKLSALEVGAIKSQVQNPTGSIPLVSNTAGNVTTSARQVAATLSNGNPAAAWNGQLLTTPHLPSAAPSSALQALLMSQANNVNLNNGMVNQSVPAAPLANPTAFQDLLSGNNNQGVAGSLLALLQPSVHAPNPYMNQSFLNGGAPLFDQMAIAKLLDELRTQNASGLGVNPIAGLGGLIAPQGGIGLGGQQVSLPQHGIGFHAGTQQGTGDSFAAPRPAQQIVGLASPRLQSVSPKEQSRLKKKKKAHLLADMCDHEDTEVNGESGHHFVKTKKAKTGASSSAQDCQLTQAEQLKTPSWQYYLPLQPENVNTENGSSITDPEDIIAKHLVKIFANQGTDSTSIRHHFGLGALIREWITLALLRRDFDLLGKASDLALKFGMGMDSISGADKDDVKNCFTGCQMDGLLPILLKPAAVQEPCMLTPNLPASLLSYISHPSCSAFGELDVQNRWIMIRETTQGVTKFYCSPMFETNVFPWTSMSQLYREKCADVFAMIFPNDHYGGLLEYLARQIASHQTQAEASPVRVPSKIRLLGKTWGNGTPSIGNVRTLDIEMMFASVQTMDTHLCYLELFKPENAKSTATGYELDVPPTYAEAHKLGKKY